MSRASTLSVCVLILVLAACSEDSTGPLTPGRVFGSGEVTTETRDLSEFNSVRVEMVATVTVGLADSQSVTVSVDDNIHEYVETAVEGNVLVIRAADGRDLSNYDLDIELQMTDLSSLSCPGVATIKSSSTLEINALRVSVSGVGTVVLRLDVEQLETLISGLGTVDYTGTSAQHSVAIPGTGTMSAYGLATADCIVGIGGSGTVLVTAINTLDVTIGGMGNVYYKGNPSITQTIEGVGQVIDAN